MEDIMLSSLVNKLKNYNKIIITGPPRSGTTIATKILSTELNYKFIDESWYDGGDIDKLNYLLFSIPRKMCIHMTAFLKYAHEYAKINEIAIVLIKRKPEEIIASMNHTINFKKGVTKANDKYNLFYGFGIEERKKILKYYEKPDEDLDKLPQVIYDYFYAHNNRFFELEYDSLKNHKLWIDLPERRKVFQHVKQINYDPNYIYTKMGFIVL